MFVVIIHLIVMKSAFFLAVSFLLVSSGCKNYSTLYQVKPNYRSDTPAGQIIARTLRSPSPPLIEMGHYLDAAAAANNSLEIKSDDLQAQEDYNFSVSRMFGIIDQAGLEPWKSPLHCPGSNKTWVFSIQRDPQPERNPSNFKIQPADHFKFKGTLVAQRTLKEGIGAPLIVMSKDVEPEKIDVFSQGNRIFYGMTGVVVFNGRNCVGKIIDPLAVETVQVNHHNYPLAADFSAPLALALADIKPRKNELRGLFKAKELESNIRLARLQPYEQEKIPVLCIHGLGDSQATWVPLIQTLRGDATIRQNYQFWFFSYPTGFPYPLVASVLRKQLDAVNRHYPEHRKIVVIGHSMGGMISRTLITDSGMKLWDAFYDKPPEKIPFSDETRNIMTESLIFNHRADVSRVIFASPSHRGADLATNIFGRLGSKIIGSPMDNLSIDSDILDYVKPNPTTKQLGRLPNSIDFLDPKNRFVTALADIPPTPSIPFHTIIGDRGKGGNLDQTAPVSTDGIVPYWSSHLAGARSELIIPSHHWTNQHPLGIAEVGRILRQHLTNQ